MAGPIPGPKRPWLGERLARLGREESDESPKKNSLNDRPEFLSYVCTQRCVETKFCVRFAIKIIAPNLTTSTTNIVTRVEWHPKQLCLTPYSPILGRWLR